MLAIALILDAILGEPNWAWKRVPHPAVLMGRLIGWFDRTLNRGDMRRAKGVVTLVLSIIVVWFFARLLSLDIFFGVFEVVGAAILLAQRSLMDHVKAVAAALGLSLDFGRTEVAKIVGRDTATLDEPGIARAAIESAAENFSDGVVAPAFWFVLLGLPGMAIYKLVNTADSMIGYRTERYEEFGWASANLDDLLNWIPARLSAALIVLGSVLRKRDRWGDGFVAAFSSRFDAVMEDAPQHRSPNAGWPEAATAYALDIALSGPRIYEGEETMDPFVNEDGEQALKRTDIVETVQILWRSWGAMLAIVIIATVLFT